MSLTLSVLLLFGGCVYLLIGGDFLVRGALAVSRQMRISPIIVGLTVVAIGTSAPELIVSLHSALTDHAEIAIGNVVGSNIANVLLVIGVPALIYPIVSSEQMLIKQTFFMLGVTIVFALMCLTGHIGRLDAWLLLGALAAGIVMTLKGGVAMPGIDIEEAKEQLDRALGLPEKTFSIAALVLLGCIFLPVGADLAVTGAVGAAAQLGVSEASIGSTIVALGTSLPELASTLVAAFRRSVDMALGNVIGSNVLNILAIMGITALIVEIPVPEIYYSRDLWILLGTTIVLATFILLRRPIGRKSGIAFCIGYVSYLVLLL